MTDNPAMNFPFLGPLPARPGIAGLALVLVAAACAPTREAVGPADDAFPQVRATEVFAAGYGAIAEKYIEPVAVADIAVEGLRGLGTIDPALAVSRDGGHVTLVSAGREVGRWPEAAADDAAGWAKLTADATAAAREASAEMKTADVESVYEAIFDGVLSDLDIFSRYAGAEEAARNRAKRDGFGGIGIRYRIEGGLPVIIEVMAKTPAAKSDLRKGDRITHVEGKSVQGLDRNQLAYRLRGPTHTQVVLTVERPSAPAPLTVALERAHIYPPTVFASADRGVVLIQIKSFNQDTARALAETLEKYHSDLGDRMKGLILDLRGNPGGLLKQSVKVADLLLTQGDIIATRGRHADSIHHYEAGGRDLAFGLPVVVLVDGKSASAAEIVAAALQDRERAVIIGTASFGKGSVQTVVRLPNDGEITLTWSRLVAPSGYLLHGIGVLPTICTSGINADDPNLITTTVDGRAKAEKAIKAWRRPGLKSEDERNRLRESCPSQRRRSGMEINTAHQILTNPTLYARALSIVAGTHEARY